MTSVFCAIFGLARNGKQGRCGHTCYFLVPLALRKCLLGSSPNPLDFGTNCPKVPALCAYCLRPGLTLRGLIFPPVRVAEQMINVRLDRHGLPHIRLGLAIFRIEGLFLSRQLLAGLFQCGPVKKSRALKHTKCYGCEICRRSEA